MEYIQDSLFGKTYQEPFPQMEEKISKPYLKRSSASSSQTPRCLRLIKADGHTQTATWETDGALLTELLTLNTSESPNGAVASTLSQILEANVPQKFYLSAKACQGILRRAEARGKELPKMLKDALIAQSQ